MKRRYLVAGVAAAAVAVTAIVWAQAPAEVPFPSPKVEQLFVSAETVTGPGHSLGAGALNNFFKRGETVVFRVFGGNNKTKLAVTDQDAKYAYIAIPGQPNLKLAYSAENAKSPWSAQWTIPATYPIGLVPFKVLFKTKSKEYGSFVQIPVVSSQLTVQA